MVIVPSPQQHLTTFAAKGFIKLSVEIETEIEVEVEVEGIVTFCDARSLTYSGWTLFSPMVTLIDDRSDSKLQRRYPTRN